MKRRNWFAYPLAVVLIAAVTWFASLHVFERPQFGERVQQRSLRSGILGETREYLVHLPEGYEHHPDRAYPVIYVLDGSSQDVHTAASAAVMARMGAFPEAIIVGIPNISGPGRQRDYTPPGMRQDVDAGNRAEGGADQFLGFLRQELMPAIERDFRASPVRVLAGNSRGGLFVVYALTADSDLFDAFVAHSPALWRDDAAMLDRLEAFLRARSSLDTNLFISLGSGENPKMTQAFQGAVETLQQQAPGGLRWRAVITQGANHGNNAERATPVALQWVGRSETFAAVLPIGHACASDCLSSGDSSP